MHVSQAILKKARNTQDGRTLVPLGDDSVKRHDFAGHSRFNAMRHLEVISQWRDPRAVLNGIGHWHALDGAQLRGSQDYRFSRRFQSYSYLSNKLFWSACAEFFELHVTAR